MELSGLTIDVSKAFRNYDEQTSTRSLEYNNIFINPKRLVRGNSKLVNILIFDLPAGKSCLNCSDCKDKCYAMKAQQQYVDTRILRDTNFFMYANNPELLKELIVEQLSGTKITTVRIHSSGDFFSQSYIEFWDEIIGMFPNIKFYAYTKVENLLNFSEIEKNDNFNLIRSLINGKLNFGSLEYCKELKSVYGAYICPATKKGSDVKCGKECSYCISNKNVCFIEH